LRYHDRVATVSERRVVFLIGAVQFINILDFVMVMPLGPDFATALGMPTSRLGYIGGAYTLAACVAGVIGSFFLDRFDRRKALGCALVGLMLGTALGGGAYNFTTLLCARFVAGAFGGPATSLSYAIIADAIAPERRGKALGAVMGAFAVASVFGVPIGLELARLGGWRLPFFCVAGLAVPIIILSILLLPPMTNHLSHPKGRRSDLWKNSTVLLSYSMTFIVMLASFMVIPNLSAYVQGNLGYPRAQLGLLYGVGGVVSFISVRWCGHLVDRHGSFITGSIGVFCLCVVIFFGFIRPPAHVPVMGLFVAYMVALGFRNVSYNTLTSKVPEPSERAQFMSFQSASQHLGSACGAFLSARILHEAGGKLYDMPIVAGASMGLTAILPVFLYLVESRVKARKAPPATIPEPI
jgi:predicted MFS family arabinose efflux permease